MKKYKYEEVKLTPIESVKVGYDFILADVKEGIEGYDCVLVYREDIKILKKYANDNNINISWFKENKKEKISCREYLNDIYKLYKNVVLK